MEPFAYENYDLVKYHNQTSLIDLEKNSLINQSEPFFSLMNEEDIDYIESSPDPKKRQF